jgi:hypothetical protein
MTTQQVESGKQERSNNSYGTRQTTPLALGRLAFSKGEGEGRPPALLIALEPLTSVLSRWKRGEAAETRNAKRKLR